MAIPALERDADLIGHSTFRLPATAAHLFRLGSLDDLTLISELPKPVLVIGQGSNTLFLDDWPGTVLINEIMGITHEVREDQVHVQVGAGESWHGFVLHCLSQGWHGLENLALIPGSVGAAPIQNIGAYGVELASFVERILAWDSQQHRLITLSANACQFAYRDSLFKQPQGQHLIILRVDLCLSLQFSPQLHYPALQNALKARGLDDNPSPDQLVQTIIALRRERLPDPMKVANVGSFFKNPIVDEAKLSDLVKSHPSLPAWPIEGKQGNHPISYKVSAAWMIDQLGFRGQSVGQVSVSEAHALVLINQGHGRAEELVELMEMIQRSVQKEFGVSLETEPRLIQR